MTSAPAYPGHNLVADGGTPPDGAAPVILVGWSPGYADTVFAGCRTAAVVDNGLDLQTRDQGSPILSATARARPGPSSGHNSATSTDSRAARAKCVQGPSA